METNDIPEILDNAISRRWVLSIVRPETGDSDLICVPLARSEELLLAHVFYDFNPDGYIIIRIEDIYDILRDEPEEFFERIMACEGVYDNLKLPKWLDLTSWRTAIASLRTGYGYCVIESLKDEDLLIGRVIEVRDWDFTFWYFDAAGKWGDELDVVDFDDLTSISFDDNYTNTIIKYISPSGDIPLERE